MLVLALMPVTPAFASQPVVTGTITETINWQATNTPNSDGSNPVTPPAGTVSGSGQITLTNTATIPIYNVDIVLNSGTTDLGAGSWTQTGGSSGVTATITKNAGPKTVEVQIPAMNAGQNVVLSYNLLPTTQSPITLSATYDAGKITDSTSSFTDVTLTASVPAGQINAISPAITVTSANAAYGAHVGNPAWTLTYTSGPGTHSSSGGNTILSWSPGSISPGNSAQLVFKAQIQYADAFNDGTNQVNIFNIATSAVTYSVTSSTQSSAGVSINSASATTAELQTGIDKQQLANGQWQFKAGVSVPSSGTNIQYELDSVSVWATQAGTGPVLNTIIAPSSGTPLPIDSTNHDASHAWPYVFDKTNPFTATGSELLTFSYNGIPAGFMKPTIQVHDSNGHPQYPISPITYGSNNGVTLLKQIYVINGYEISVTKTITPLGNNQYKITITAQNIGTGKSPDVYVYDIVPSAFYNPSGSPVSPTGFTYTPNTITAIGNTPVTGGQAYYWDLGQMNHNDLDTIVYTVTGTGTYTPTDLYVVGVDPAQSLNLQSAPILSNVSTMATANFETLAALGAAGLLLIGMVGNFRRRM